MKKRALFICVIAILLFTLSSCGKLGEGQTTKTKEISSISKVSFSVLDSWVEKSSSEQDYGSLGKGKAIDFSFKKENRATIASIETNEPIVFKPSESIGVMESQLLNIENIKEKTIEEIEVAGKPAARARINAVEHNSDIYGEIIVIDNDKHMIIIVVRGKADQKDIIDKGIQTILDSFKFL